MIRLVMDRRRATGTALVLVSAIGFGSASILARPVYDTGMDWLGLVSWRFIIGAILAWAWVAISPTRRASLRRLDRRQVAVTIGLGALFTGNSGTYYAALETVPAALAGVLVYTYPVIVALLSIRFATRLPGRRPWIALALALVGVILALGGIDVGSAPPIAGIVLVMLSSVIYSVWIILSARMSGERRDRLADEAGTPGDAAATTAVMITSSALVFAVLSVVSGGSIDPRDVPSDAWPAVIAIGFLASFLAIQTFYAGARRIGAAQAALLSTVEPATIVALAWLVLGQRLEPVQLVGAVLIMVSVVVAQTSPRPHGAPEPAMPLDAEAPAED